MPSRWRNATGWARDKIFTPRVDEDAYQQKLQEIRQHLPVPVIWLLGKTQSGKTSIIHALTRHPRAEIGNGFQPCTRTSQLYSFPNEQAPIVRFLDTRGLGEQNYDPSEDLQQFLQQSHLLIVVVRALDHALQPLLAALQTVRKTQPHWPILVVQTHLHEGYARLTDEHVTPYPFQSDTWPATLPSDLVRSLRHQREQFAKVTSHFVAVDITLPEDGYADPYYGTAELWEQIERLMPLGLQGMILNQRPLNQAFQNLHSQTAHPQIIAHALLSGGLALVPIPLVSLPMVTTVQGKLFQTIASIYGQSVTWKAFAEFLGALGLGMLLSVGGKELTKLVPGYGAVVSSIYTAATTYALGKTMCLYFEKREQGIVPDAESLKRLYAEQLEEGRQVLRRYLSRSESTTP